MKLSIKQSVRIAIFVLFAILFIAHKSFSQSKQFAGHWQLNHDKTTFGKLPESSMPVDLNISLTNDTIVVKRTTRSSEGESFSYEDKLPLNGNVSVNVLGTTQKKSAIKKSNDSRTFVEKADYRDETYNKTYNATETWTISADGKTLTISRIDDGDDGHMESKAVYEKVN